MELPKYHQMYRAFLEVLMDGKIHSLKEVKKHVIKCFKLSDDQLAELLPSGRRTIFENRISWCRTYLSKAQLIDSPGKGQYKITKNGIRIYNENSAIDNKTLKQFPTFVEFISRNTSISDNQKQEENTETNDDETPQETLERMYLKINQSLANDVLEEVCEMNPYKFESLVVDLLVKMGYGRLQYKSHVTRKSGDEGIDGVVTADKLGFDSIYIQAKRYNKDYSVGRPDIQKFVGALAGQGAQKGIFITTSTYTKDAITFAGKNLNYKLVLIDGNRLAELMLEYELGVSTQYTYQVKQIDRDYFSEE